MDTNELENPITNWAILPRVTPTMTSELSQLRSVGGSRPGHLEKHEVIPDQQQVQQLSHWI